MVFDRRALLAGCASVALAPAAGAAPVRWPRGRPAAPRPPRRPVRLESHGRARTDDYGWMRNPDWFTGRRAVETLRPEIRAHIEAENAYCEAMLEPEKAFREEVLREMLARSAGAEVHPPEPRGPWEYFSRLQPGAQYPQFLRRPRGGGAEELLFDGEAEGRGKPYFRLSPTGPVASPDHRLVAWGADEGGKDYYEVHVVDIESGRAAPPIEDSFGFDDFAFSADSKWIYWLRRDARSWPSKVFRRPVMGGEDVLVYEETDPAFFMSIGAASSGRTLFIRISNIDTSEVRFIPGDDPTGRPRLVAPREKGVIYDVDDWGDRFVIRTNADGARDYKLMTAAPAAPGRSNWRDLVPHRAGRFITAVKPFRDHLARIEWVDALPRLVVTGADGRDDTAAFDEPAYSIGFAPGSDWEAGRLRYAYESPRTPRTWFDRDLRTGRTTVAARQEVPGFDAARYEVRRVEVPAADGARIPVTLLMRKGTEADGSAPLYMFGYGSYGYSLEADFAAPRLSLADRGWVVALAHIRGGAERGTDWWLQAKALGKRVSITDWVDSAAGLCAAGWTRPGRVVCHSYSAGGLIVGGGINLRPELFAGAIAVVPFVDGLNTMEDETNPLVESAKPIWGDPADPAAFDYIASYTPYENVGRKPYPAVLAVSGLLDDRVGYWEAAKWTARLRENTTSGKPVLNRTNMLAGHMGEAGLERQLAQTALFWAFAKACVDGTF